jgi:hypothetical protein
MSTVSLEDFVESLLSDIDDGIANGYLLKNRLLKSPVLLKHFKFKTDMDHFSFSDALEYLKQGKKVSRSIWKNMYGIEVFIGLDKGRFDGPYLGFKDGSQPTAGHGSTIDGVPLDCFTADIRGTKTIAPALCMGSTESDELSSWSPSDNDLLAVDWYVVE